MSGIGAHRIARDVGYTAGTIYNVFGNLDGHIMRLRAETLDEMHARHHEARVLWSSLHGIVSLEVIGRVGIGESVQLLTECLIDNYVFALIERGARAAAD